VTKFKNSKIQKNYTFYNSKEGANTQLFNISIRSTTTLPFAPFWTIFGFYDCRQAITRAVSGTKIGVILLGSKFGNGVGQTS
jgi:hypothetical protein